MTAGDLFYLAAAARLSEGDPAHTRDACRAGLRAAPDHPGLHELLGLALHDLEEPGPAVHHLETASALAPLSPAGQLALADLYLGFGLVESAAAVLRFLAEPGRCPASRLPAVARGLGRLGDYAAALGVCERLAADRPWYHPAWFGMAFYLRQLGRPAAALIRPLEAAAAAAPDALTYRLNLAAVYADVGRAADAYALVRDVPAAAVGCPCLCRRLAAAFAAAGDAAGQAAYLEQAGRPTGGAGR